MPILLTILGISLLIFVHELGHYLAARAAGVRVHVFSLGFGPRLFGFERGGTDYRVSALPLGGYVQVAGEDPTSDRRRLASDDLHAKGFLARAVFFSGGVAMNLLFALIAFPLVFRHGVEFDAPVIGAVEAGSPAWEAGLEPGDRILSVDGKAMYSMNNLQVEIALANPRRGTSIEIERDGRREHRLVHPRYDETLGIRQIGIEGSLVDEAPTLAVDEDGPAFAAGLRDGDRLIELDGRPLRPLPQARTVNRALNEGIDADAITLTVERSLPGSAAPERLTRGLRPKQEPSGRHRLGVIAAPRTVKGLRDHPGIAALGLRRGDEILFVDGLPFTGRELDLTGTGATLALTVRRPGLERPIVLEAEIAATERAALAAGIALKSGTGLTILPVAGSPAAAAGLRDGDEIRVAAGRKAEDLDEWDELVEVVSDAEGRPIPLTVLRPSEGLVSLTVTPESIPAFDRGFAIEVRPLRTLYKIDTIGGGITAGFTASVDLIKQLYVTIKKLFTGDVSTRNLSGIITISRVSYMFAQEGLARLFYFLAILSINLAVINVLPIPVLDGGHLMFLLIERIKGSPVSARVHGYSQMLGLVFVLVLLVYVTYNDILRLNLFS